VAKDYEMCVAHIMNTSQILKIPYIVLIALKKTFTPLATYIEQNKFLCPSYRLSIIYVFKSLANTSEIYKYDRSYMFNLQRHSKQRVTDKSMTCIPEIS